MPIRCSVIRGGTSKGLYFHAGDLPHDVATRDAVLARRDGLTGRSRDRRHGWRTSPDVQGRRRARVHSATTRTSTISSCRCGPIAPRSPTTRTAATSSPASGPSPSKRAWSSATGDTTNGADLDGEHAEPRRRAACRRRTARSATTATRTSTACPARTRPIPIEFLDVAGSSCGALLADRPRRRRHRGDRGHLHRQRHAGRLPRRPPMSDSPGYEESRRHREQRASVCEIVERSASPPDR